MSILTPDEQETLSRLCRESSKQELCTHDKHTPIEGLEEQRVG